MLTLLTGGARSGKSALAVRMAADHERDGGTVVFVATAPRIPGDDDFDRRIDRHRAERPAGWTTIEEPHDLIAALSNAGSSFVIVDCLTLWVQNLRWRGDTDEQIERAARDATRAAVARDAPTVVVTNEVGLGIHPATVEGREFRDTLGRINHLWSAAADRAWFVAAGRVLELRPSEVAR